MTKHFIPALALSALCVAGTARAADAYKVDPVHSMAVFQINHFGVSNPFGIFHAATGEVQVDGDAITGVEVSLPVEKLDMGNERWEKHIESADFLNAKQFPTIEFKADSVKKTGDATYEAAGSLTMHGVTKPLTVTLSKEAAAVEMDKKQHVGFGASFTVKRSDFGVTYLDGPVGDDVTLMVNVEAGKE